jgi:hypothetical protein
MGKKIEQKVNMISAFFCDITRLWVVPTFRDNLSVKSSGVKNNFFLDFLTLEDGTDMLPRNVGTELPLNAA